MLFNPPPINKQVNKQHIKIILEYSPINNKANLPAPYSTLNPDTNSDSPSAKSNGDRFVSAKQDTSHNANTGGTIQINQAVVCSFNKSNNIKDLDSIRTINNKNAILTSYEIL